MDFLMKIMLSGISFVFIASCMIMQERQKHDPLAGKCICIDPGHGGTAATDQYRIGLAGEREEWIDMRVALMLRDMLEERGARVIMTRIEDVQVALKGRAILSVDNNADVFLSIHHNATADRSVNFPIIYYHGNASENEASVFLGKCLALRLREAMFMPQTPVSLVSDHTIFPQAGTAVLRHSYGIPGIIGEASFFSNPEEEQRLKDESYNRKEAQAYLRALEDFFSAPVAPIMEIYSGGKVDPFEVFQEDERMNETAQRWYQDYLDAHELMQSEDMQTLQRAYDLFTRSARSFPDSWVARECHAYRAELLRRFGREGKAAMELRRVAEYYVDLK